jgi:NAD(P)H dehydrogenase (quinone)
MVYRARSMGDARFAAVCEELGQRLDTLATTAPIPYRQQNAGDYEIPAMTLKDAIAPELKGFAAHLVQPPSLL